MKKFKEHLNEDKASQNTLLNYLSMAMVRLANKDNVDVKAMMLLVGAITLANNQDPNAGTMARKLAQLALSKANIND